MRGTKKSPRGRHSLRLRDLGQKEEGETPEEEGEGGEEGRGGGEGAAALIDRLQRVRVDASFSRGPPGFSPLLRLDFSSK